MNHRPLSNAAIGVVLVLVTAVAVAAPSARRAISVDDLLSVQRVADVQLSPDGQWVAYSVGVSNVDTNQGESNIWLASTSHDDVRQVTRTGKDRAPRWSPDGKKLAFLSRRDGKSQVYLLDVAGGEAQQLTKLASDVETLRWLPNGASLVITSSVWPDCADDACNKSRDEQRARESSARVYERWPYAKAMSWVDGKRSHLFVVNATAPATPRNLTPKWPRDIPFSMAIDGSIDGSDIAVSPDSQEVVFTAGAEIDRSGQMIAKLWRVPLAGGTPQRLTQNDGVERAPAYSPDGRSIAYRWNGTPANTGGYGRVMRLDRATGKSADLTPKGDRNASTIAWTSDGKSLLFLAEQEVRQPLFVLPATTGATARALVDGFVGEVSVAARGTGIAYARSSFTSPPEIFFVARPGGTERQVTRHNQALLGALDLPAPETFWFPGKDGTRVQAILLRPPGAAAAKVPLLVLLHGGPHTTWTDSWGPRWNPEVFAAPGRAVLIVNRRGSTAYGQKFSDEVVGEWGGRSYDDVMSGIDAALAKYSWIDGDRLTAAGASYGGYMANWIATHSGRFKAIVSHSGVYDTTVGYSSDIPWFVEFETRGLPWSSPDFAKWSPATYADALGKYKTPMLVTSGEKDYRVPYQQSLMLFSALQRQGVPSKLMIFPDAGHWILKPKDSKLWYEALLEWIAKYE